MARVSFIQGITFPKYLLDLHAQLESELLALPVSAILEALACVQDSKHNRGLYVASWMMVASSSSG